MTISPLRSFLEVFTPMTICLAIQTGLNSVLLDLVR